ncbi:MAG: hypothetical protein JW751_08650, partial [Polyangiaceae bacterium]|nr:hypothetical protein [Polyangiaceae bacterium]
PLESIRAPRTWHQLAAGSWSRGRAKSRFNAIGTAYKGASTDSALATTVSEIARLLARHVVNDGWSGPGIGVGSFDTSVPPLPITLPVSFHLVTDSDNAPRVTGTGTRIGLAIALAQLWRAFEAHRVAAGVHTASDFANALTALPKLLAIYRSVIAELDTPTPTVPPGDSAGAVALVAAAGLTRGSAR